MKSFPLSQQVFDDIGEKPLRTFAQCVAGARTDLADYRRLLPHFVADHSERGLANWISDRLWARLVNLAEAVPGMEMIEQGVLREVTIGYNFRLRVKRHDVVGDVASYPTPTFLEFAEQPEGQLEGLKETRLIAGYEWLKDRRDIGDAVMSLRDGKDNIIWCERLPLPEEGEAGGDVITPQTPTPPAPVVDVGDIGQKAKDSADDE
jgi:hypothetical protein